MKKVIVIGCPGSGKSTFARRLHSATGLPLCHLDRLNWNTDGTTVPKEVFLSRLNEVIGTACWIIDGNYSSSLEPRLAACDTVFFLDYPTQVCLDGVLSRRGKARPDIPWVEPAEAVDEGFLRFIRDFPTQSRPGILALLERYPEKSVYTFTSRREADEYLISLSQNR